LGVYFDLTGITESSQRLFVKSRIAPISVAQIVNLRRRFAISKQPLKFLNCLGGIPSTVLEFSASELKRMGGAPVIVFLIVTLFNTVLGLIVAWLIFGIALPLPK
jgi:hypothetical protein